MNKNAKYVYPRCKQEELRWGNDVDDLVQVFGQFCNLSDNRIYQDGTKSHRSYLIKHFDSVEYGLIDPKNGNHILHKYDPKDFFNAHPINKVDLGGYEIVGWISERGVNINKEIFKRNGVSCYSLPKTAVRQFEFL